jgi:hypothetical protein
MQSIYNGPANWRSADMKQSEWMINLSQSQIDEFDRALKLWKSKGMPISEMTQENFNLPEFAPLVTELRDRLENGRGVVVLRGLPAMNYSREDLRLLYWGIGKALGTAVSQSSKGDLLGDVRNFGSDVNGATGRGYMSKQQLPFHSDTSDVVALIVLRKAKSGGRSMICSSLAIRNEIAATRPDLLDVLYQPFYWSWKGQEAPGEKPYYLQPVYTEHDGKFASRYIEPHIIVAHENFPELPPLTALQREALDMVNRLANDPTFHFGMMFEPGDIQLLNNHVTYHARTEFEDFDEEDSKRHLLRMWLSMPTTRALSPGLKAIYQDQRAGAVRGGFPSRTGSHSFETVKAQD